MLCLFWWVPSYSWPQKQENEPIKKGKHRKTKIWQTKNEMHTHIFRGPDVPSAGSGEHGAYEGKDEQIKKKLYSIEK